MVKPMTKPTTDATLNVRFLNKLRGIIGSETFDSTTQKMASKMTLAIETPTMMCELHA